MKFSCLGYEEQPAMAATSVRTRSLHLDHYDRHNHLKPSIQPRGEQPTPLWGSFLFEEREAAREGCDEVWVWLAIAIAPRSSRRQNAARATSTSLTLISMQDVSTTKHSRLKDDEVERSQPSPSPLGPLIVWKRPMPLNAVNTLFRHPAIVYSKFSNDVAAPAMEDRWRLARRRHGGMMGDVGTQFIVLTTLYSNISRTPRLYLPFRPPHHEAVGPHTPPTLQLYIRTSGECPRLYSTFAT
ncbi:hypothetical protein NLJ89_g11779 [Agrocybe chaxingu]|uniref:Uncharacterized protein n=1 Tax=Agrocybe chaxingu TaxID=84603 RepID=A0A9W8JRR0_9AGAR|nr:hypothetical protein NLJ89_g11779 [Agrocybe chaxingu]